jgi:hypothetical protein
MMAVVAVMLALVLLVACGAPTYHWESSKYRVPFTAEQHAQFERDRYECNRENTHPSAYANRYYGTSGAEVHYENAMSCMSARGWYYVRDKK